MKVRQLALAGSALVASGITAGVLLIDRAETAAVEHAFVPEVTRQTDQGIDGEKFSVFWLRLAKIEPDNETGLTKAGNTLAEQLGGATERNLALAHCAIAGANGKLSFKEEESAPVRREVRTAGANFSFQTSPTVAPEGLRANCYEINRQAVAEPGHLFVPVPEPTR